MTAPTKRKAKARPKAGTSRQAAADRRNAFVEAYLANGGNGLQAALAAGFAQKSAGVTACKLLKDHRVLAALTQRRTEVAEKLGLTTERTLLEVARLAYLDPRKFFNADGSPKAITDLDDDCAAAIAGMEVQEVYEGTGENRVFVGHLKKFKLADKNAALEKAMKFHGLYERDNSQKTDPLTALLAELGKRRSTLPIAE